MIQFQIVERFGADLYRSLLDSMRSGALQTFSASKRGRKVSHVKHPGWIKWSKFEGVITCEVVSPQKPDNEWQLMHAFLGRLAARFAPSIDAINIQFPMSMQTANNSSIKGRSRKTKARRRRSVR